MTDKIIYKSVSISGIRFARLPGKSYYDAIIVRLKKLIKNRLINMYENYGVKIVLNGFAEGIDLLTVLAVSELIDAGYDFKLVACLPSPGETQCTYFSEESKELYRMGLSISEKVIETWTVKGYRGSTVVEGLLKRNLLMRDFSDTSLVVTDFYKKGGGTSHFFNNSVKCNRDMSVIDLNKFNGETDVLECHSEGDKRFSALYAKVKLQNYRNQTIEELYQLSKGFNRLVDKPKGKMPDFYNIDGHKVNIKHGQDWYMLLWVVYILNHPLAYEDLQTYDKFNDKFKRHDSYVDQASTLELISSKGIKSAIERISLLANSFDLFEPGDKIKL